MKSTIRLTLVVLSSALAVFSPINGQAASTYTLGTTNRIEGPSPSADSIAVGVITPSNGTWSVSTTAPWLHINGGSINDTGSTNAFFNFDTNDTGAPRTNTLTVASQSVTVIQAPSPYVPAGLVTNLFSIPSNPRWLAVDTNTGNVFVSDGYTVWKWVAASSTLAPVAFPDLTEGSAGLAVDKSGNLYIADNGSNLIKMLPAGGTTSTPLSVVTHATGLHDPEGVAVDNNGDLFIADSDNAAVKELASGATVPVVVATSGFVAYGISVDLAGNIYVPDYYNPSIIECQAGQNAWITLTGPYADAPYNPQDFWDPLSVVGDGSGSVYIGDTLGGLRSWTAADNTLSGFIGDVVSESVGMDSVGNIYSADFLQEQIDYLPYAYVDPTPRSFGLKGGDGAIPPVVPSTANLNGAFAPTSDSSWLTITGTAGDVVTYHVPVNTGVARTGHINLLGVPIAISQSGYTYSLAASSTDEGPSAGQDSIDLTVSPIGGAWTAAAHATWLHLSAPDQSGTGSQTIIFSFDSNPGAARTGTLTIGGQTYTVTQVGTGYVSAGTAGALAGGLVLPYGVAVDASGDVFFADSGSKTVKEWSAATGTVTVLVSSGLTDPTGVAVDGAGDVFIADGTGNKIYELPSGGSLTPLVTSGLNDPTGIAVDGSGDLYIADSGDNTIFELPAGGSLTALVTSGLHDPTGIAVDDSGDVFVADSGDNSIYEVPAGGGLTPLVTAGLDDPTGVAVDSAGDVFIADTGDNAIYELPSGGTLTYISMDPNGVAVSSSGNIYFSDGQLGAVEEFQYAYVDTAPLSEGASAGSDALPPVIPATADLTGSFAPTSDSSWLTVTGTSDGVVNFSFQANFGTTRTGHITVLGQAIAITQSGPTYALGATARLEGPASGSDSVVLAVTPATGAWTATVDASWLHLSGPNSSGAGSTNVIFSFDGNSGPTRASTLMIAGQALTVTQVGAPYVAGGAASSATLVAGVFPPSAVAVDASENVYFTQYNVIDEWQTNGSTTSLSYLSAGDYPAALAVDGASNVYFADQENSAIEEQLADGSMIFLVSGVSDPAGVAVDGAGNVYFSSVGPGTIQEWNVSTSQTITLVSGLNQPGGVAVDAAGNVYFTQTGSSTVNEWLAANNTVIALAGYPQVFQPSGIAVDGAGNVYIADPNYNAIEEWSAASNSVTTVASGLNYPASVAVDAAGNVYIADTDNDAIKEIPNAYVDTEIVVEPNTSGNDSLPPVLPANANLTGPFAPVTTTPWIGITGVANGIVGFSFTANTGSSSRSGQITVLGQPVTIVQNGPYSLSTYSRLENPNGGYDSVIVVVASGFPSWSSSANDSWLHIQSGSGTGSGTVTFIADYNPDATRSGTLTIAGETLTIVQAGATYVQTSTVADIVDSGIGQPQGVAVDKAGNVYIADPYYGQIEVWSPATGSTSTLVSSAQGLNYPAGVAVDAGGNVYIADADNQAIEEWTDGSLVTLVNGSSGLNYPVGVAVDSAGNVYIVDSGNDTLTELPAGGSSLITLASGLENPSSVAVDAAGNVYVANTYGSYDVIEWSPTTGNPRTLESNLLPFGVAVDVAGNVYAADDFSDGIQELTPSYPYPSLLVSGFSQPQGVAVDASGNVYIADTGDEAVAEAPYAFVDPTPINEGAAAGGDALPIILPYTVNLNGPFAPSSDSSWLTVNTPAYGVVSFSFTANNGSDRTGNITVLGQTVSVTQTGAAPSSPSITGPQLLGPGTLQFTFTGTPGASYTVLSTTNLALPLSAWMVEGQPTSVSPGVYQFTSSATTNDPQRFYAVRSP